MSYQTKVSEHVEYENQDGVGVWTIDDIEEALDSGSLEKGEEHFLDKASDDSMNAAVVEIGNSGALTKETLQHVKDSWTELHEQVGIDATAYVADGLSRLALVNKNETDRTELEAFEDTENALEWAKEF